MICITMKLWSHWLSPIVTEFSNHLHFYNSVFLLLDKLTFNTYQESLSFSRCVLLWDLATFGITHLMTPDQRTCQATAKATNSNPKEMSETTMIYDLEQKNISWKNIYISPERLHYYDELILLFNTIMRGATVQNWKGENQPDDKGMD